jgi:hypothetical protein
VGIGNDDTFAAGGMQFATSRKRRVVHIVPIGA